MGIKQRPAGTPQRWPTMEASRKRSLGSELADVASGLMRKAKKQSEGEDPGDELTKPLREASLTVAALDFAQADQVAKLMHEAEDLANQLVTHKLAPDACMGFLMLSSTDTNVLRKAYHEVVSVMAKDMCGDKILSAQACLNEAVGAYSRARTEAPGAYSRAQDKPLETNDDLIESILKNPAAAKIPGFYEAWTSIFRLLSVSSAIETGFEGSSRSLADVVKQARYAVALLAKSIHGTMHVVDILGRVTIYVQTLSSCEEYQSIFAYEKILWPLWRLTIKKLLKDAFDSFIEVTEEHLRRRSVETTEPGHGTDRHECVDFSADDQTDDTENDKENEKKNREAFDGGAREQLEMISRRVAAIHERFFSAGKIPFPVAGLKPRRSLACHDEYDEAMRIYDDGNCDKDFIKRLGAIEMSAKWKSLVLEASKRDLPKYLGQYQNVINLVLGKYWQEDSLGEPVLDESLQEVRRFTNGFVEN